MHSPPQRLQFAGQFEQIDQQHEQLIVPPLAHGVQQRPRQDLHFARGSEQITAGAVVERHGKGDVVLGQKPLQEENAALVVFEQQAGAARPKPVPLAEERGQLFAPAAPLPAPPGKRQDEGTAQEPHESVVKHPHTAQEGEREQDKHRFGDRQQNGCQRIAAT